MAKVDYRTLSDDELQTLQDNEWDEMSYRQARVGKWVVVPLVVFAIFAFFVAMFYFRG